MSALKLYKIEYDYYTSSPSSPEKSIVIVIAENELEASNIIKENIMSCSNYQILKHITEIPMEKGIVYTGYSCC